MSHDLEAQSGEQPRHSAPEVATEGGLGDASGVASPARRQLFGIAAGLGGLAVANAIFGVRPAHADFVKTVGKVLYLDPIVLNFAFELEELEADFFGRLPRSRGYSELSGREQDILSVIAAQDRNHYDQINAVRDMTGYKDGGRFESRNTESTRRARTFHYPKLNTRDEVIKASLDLKESALFAYHGAVELVKDNTLLTVAASIAGVEGRHTAVLREVAGLDPVPAPFEGALTAQVSGAKLSKAYGFAGGSRR